MLYDVFKNVMLAGLGIQEKMKEFMDDLVKKGELNDTQAAKLVKEWSTVMDKTTIEFPVFMTEIIEKAFMKMNLPTKKDIGVLIEKIDSLAEKIDAIKKS